MHIFRSLQTLKFTNLSIFDTICFLAFNRDIKSSKAGCKIYTVHGEGTMPQSTACCWFLHLKNQNFNFKDGSYTGRPIECDEEQLNTFIMNINIKRSEQINCNTKTVVNHLHSKENVQNMRKMLMNYSSTQYFAYT